ncbi:amidase domain-containing protein [Agromyces laixinhei]|uniref:amidase domain-containing protein n=1 Tax=Agromyces laixinhei TaxID=2585717 RepID=UPI0012ED1565|nr:amidase domain-containing protein [Agromyces laixinhei]
MPLTFFSSASTPAEPSTESNIEPPAESSIDLHVDPSAASADAIVGRTRRRARHRAERVRKGRQSSSSPRRFVALGCAGAILSVSAFGAVAAASAENEAPASAAGGTSAIAAAARDVIIAPASAAKRPAVTSELSTAAAPFTGGTQVSVTGEQLDQVAAVAVGGVAAPIVAATPEQLTFQVPAVADTALGEVAVAFTDASGAPVDVDAADGDSATTASVAAQGSKGAQAAAKSLTLTYTSNPAIDAQLGYVLTHWSSYNTAEYTVLSGVDCANFASQSLIARGWTMDAGWNYDHATGAMSSSWASSTAMRDWLSSRPDLATPLDDSQRGLVKVGDIAQFDWDGSGDRDHTAIVTRVEHSATGTSVWVGGHTKDADYWNVDEAVATGGGSVTYFSLK